jgi:hypothetical protein
LIGLFPTYYSANIVNSNNFIVDRDDGRCFILDAEVERIKAQEFGLRQNTFLIHD